MTPGLIPVSTDAVSVAQTAGLRSRGDWLAPVVTLWLSLLLFSFLHAPIPGVNEPHYLTKARHYWQPDWCSGDLFLESANAHLFFYQTAGLLTQVVSLPLAAIIGRCLAYLLVAAGWHRLCRACGGDRWSGLQAGWLMMLLNSIGSLSGEWLVGGVESKVFAWACVFFAMSGLLENRRAAVGFWLGLATAFHPLVGLWSVIAVLMSWGLRCPLSVWHDLRRLDRGVTRAVLLFLGVAWLGIVPALAAVRGATPQEAFAANLIQVFYRLPHHLDPMTFKPTACAGYAVLSVVLVVLTRVASADSEQRLASLNRFVVAAGIIAMAGIVIGYGPRPADRMPLYELRMSLLKFYPFRLFDLMLPVLAAITAARLISTRRLLSVLLSRRVRFGLPLAGFLVALGLSAGRGSLNRLPERQRAGWLDVCAWVRENSPPGSLFVTPNEGYAFKWFAERPEYVALKDCPQDARPLIEWNERLRFIRKWGRTHFAGGGYSAEAMRLLHEHTQANFLIAGPRDRMDAPEVYSNGVYRVLRLAPAGRQSEKE